jgi:hypothetical protein
MLDFAGSTHTAAPVVACQGGHLQPGEEQVPFPVLHLTCRACVDSKPLPCQPLDAYLTGLLRLALDLQQQHHFSAQKDSNSCVSTPSTARKQGAQDAAAACTPGSHTVASPHASVPTLTSHGLADPRHPHASIPIGRGPGNLFAFLDDQGGDAVCAIQCSPQPSSASYRHGGQTNNPSHPLSLSTSSLSTTTPAQPQSVASAPASPAQPAWRPHNRHWGNHVSPPSIRVQGGGVGSTSSTLLSGSASPTCSRLHGIETTSTRSGFLGDGVGLDPSTRQPDGSVSHVLQGAWSDPSPLGTIGSRRPAATVAPPVGSAGAEAPGAGHVGRSRGVLRVLTHTTSLGSSNTGQDGGLQGRQHSSSSASRSTRSQLHSSTASSNASTNGSSRQDWAVSLAGWLPGGQGQQQLRPVSPPSRSSTSAPQLQLQNSGAPSTSIAHPEPSGNISTDASSASAAAVNPGLQRLWQQLGWAGTQGQGSGTTSDLGALQHQSQYLAGSPEWRSRLRPYCALPAALLVN